MGCRSWKADVDSTAHYWVADLPSSLAVRWSRQGQARNQAAKPSILYLKGKMNTYQHGLRKLIIRKGKIMKYTALAF